MATTTESTKHTFLSKGAYHRIVRYSRDPVRDHSGMIVEAAKTVAYDFYPDGKLEVWSGHDIRADGPLDEDGRPTEQDAVEFLRNHHRYQREDGFHEVGREPGRLLPTVEERVQAIIDAAVSLDAEAVQSVIDEEKADHNREPVIQAGERALEKLRAAVS